MNSKITMEGFKNAQYAVGVIAEVTTSLKKLDFGTLKQCPIKSKKVSDFIGFLSNLADEYEKVVSQAKIQHEARPQHLINAASHRVCAIPGAIDLEQKRAQSQINQHDTKTSELQNQGFNERQILEILPYPQAELDEHEVNINNLKAEQKNLEQFLSDQLLCDTSLLEGAKLEPYLQHQPCSPVEQANQTI
ncbi:hypothetical protein [Methylobacter sp.]|uniref:hypothetical protein n=1 Tax=Methylobacter sp. TaxID=2051955 RepID=UPI002489AEFD|nr:hypothetical protein [Methylobacter sp.]MDI1277291.1 hypothetical protein [Methylobacter sp.]MDI1357857.1 hypothetical protein [Methylobacter sp.]